MFKLPINIADTLKLSLLQCLIASVFIICSWGVTIQAQVVEFEEVERSGSGVLNVHWHGSKPFIYKNEDGSISGIEYDILIGFKEYLMSRKGLNISLNMIEDPAFYKVIDAIEMESAPNHIGASALSITNKREERVDFTDPYFSEVSVLISSGKILDLHNYDDLKKIAQTNTAVTIEGTTYEAIFDRLEMQLGTSFKITYVPSNSNIIEYIVLEEGRYGFIDLPVYLLYLKNGYRMNRYDEFTVIGNGFGFIFPTGSSWRAAFNEYLADPLTKTRLKELFISYLGEDISLFFQNMDSYSGIQEPLYAKEKELVQKNLDATSKILEREQQLRYYQTLLSGVSFILLIIVLYLFLKMKKSNKKLIESESSLRNERDKRAKDNKRLINRNAQIRQINNERSNLFHMIVHDLKSPVNNIKGIVSLIQDDSNLDREMQNELLTKVSDSCEKMSMLIEQIFNEDESIKSDFKILKEEVDLVNLLQQITDTYKIQASRKNISIDFDSSEEEIKLLTDYMQLNQLFDNLLSNALKFSAEGKKVWIRVEQDQTKIQVHIKDQGPGFSEEDKENLFIAFKKLSAQPTQGESSTGLGLSIVKKCIDNIGAEIELNSTKGEGAEFIIHLSKG